MTPVNSHEWKAYWPIFHRLEDEVCDLTFAVAFSDDHREVYSARLSELLLRICAECENIAKSICIVREFTPSGAKVEDFNFPALGNAICSQIAIHTKEVAIVWPYQSFTSTRIKPFDTWKLAGSSNPAWFDAYNKAKHDRVASAKKSNVWNVVNALGGLFILNLCLREGDITGHPEEHISVAQMRVTSYSKFFSPEQFLKLQNDGGLSGPMSGSNLRSLTFEW